MLAGWLRAMIERDTGRLVAVRVVDGDGAAARGRARQRVQAARPSRPAPRTLARRSQHVVRSGHPRASRPRGRRGRARGRAPARGPCTPRAVSRGQRPRPVAPAREPERGRIGGNRRRDGRRRSRSLATATRGRGSRRDTRAAERKEATIETTRRDHARRRLGGARTALSTSIARSGRRVRVDPEVFGDSRGSCSLPAGGECARGERRGVHHRDPRERRGHRVGPCPTGRAAVSSTTRSRRSGTRGFVSRATPARSRRWITLRHSASRMSIWGPGQAVPVR